MIYAAGALLTAISLTSASQAPAPFADTGTSRQLSAVPGDSPFQYMSNPANDLFRIETLNLSPRNCMIGQSCALQAYGSFTQDLAAMRFVSNIFLAYSDGDSGEVDFVDDFCRWARVVQDGREQCPPKRGSAIVTYATDLPFSWIPQANYTIEIDVASSNKVFHIIGSMELRNMDASQPATLGSGGSEPQSVAGLNNSNTEK